jgi:hypothetical protein
LLQSGDAWQQALAVLRAQGEEAPVFERVYVEAMRRLEALAAQDHVRWYDQMRIILSWGLWRRPRAERQTLLAAAQATRWTPGAAKACRHRSACASEAAAWSRRLFARSISR